MQDAGIFIEFLRYVLIFVAILWDNFERNYSIFTFWTWVKVAQNLIGLSLWIVSHHSIKFHKDFISSFWVICN